MFKLNRFCQECFIRLPRLVLVGHILVWEWERVHAPWYGIPAVLRVQCSTAAGRSRSSCYLGTRLTGTTMSGLGRYWVQSIKGGLQSIKGGLVRDFVPLFWSVHDFVWTVPPSGLARKVDFVNHALYIHQIWTKDSSCIAILNCIKNTILIRCLQYLIFTWCIHN